MVVFLRSITQRPKAVAFTRCQRALKMYIFIAEASNWPTPFKIIYLSMDVQSPKTKTRISYRGKPMRAVSLALQKGFSGLILEPSSLFIKRTKAQYMTTPYSISVKHLEQFSSSNTQWLARPLKNRALVFTMSKPRKLFLFTRAQVLMLT